MSAPIPDQRTKAQLRAEIEQIRARLEEAEQTLDAIRHGDVDALVVSSPQGEQVYSLTGAERVYRVVVETMQEAALTVSVDGTILFCNQRFCDLMKTPMPEITSQKLTAFIDAPQHGPLAGLLAGAQVSSVHRRFTFRAADGAIVPALVAASLLAADGNPSLCLVVTDLTELEASANSIKVLREHERTLEEQQAELERFNRVMVGRELRMIELKQEINELLAQAGQRPRYALTDRETPAIGLPPGGGSSPGSPGTANASP
jgi:PAS domain S-box-containing protein